MALCILCQNILGSNYASVGDNGRRTLVAASLKRKDGLHQLLETSNPLQVHATCRKAYTRDTSIKRDKRRVSEAVTEEDAEPTILRSRTRDFDISSQCLFCSERIEISSKIPLKRRKSFNSVEKNEFKESVFKRIEERFDDWGFTVGLRIDSVIDLVKAEAKYHRV